MKYDKKPMSQSSAAYRVTRTARPVAAISLLAIALSVGCATNRAPSRQIDDAAITIRVESRLAANPNTNNFEIDVDTLDGVVRLGGTVETAEQREDAERTAASTSGVRDVDNDLQLGDPRLIENVDDVLISRRNSHE